MYNFLKRNIYLLLLVFLSLIVYHIWFFTLGIIKSGDWGYFYKDALTTLNIHWFSMWLGDTYGRVLFDVGQAPTYALYGFLTKYLNFDFVLNERIVYLWPVALFTPLFSYLLLRTLSFNKTAAFVGAVVYTFNTYFLVLQTGHMTLMGAFCFAPLVILMYIKTLNVLTLRRSLITGLLLSLEFAYEPRSAYITLWILFFYFLCFILSMQKRAIKKNIVKVCTFAGLPIVMLGFFNIGWIIGLLHTQSNSVNEVLGRSLFGNDFYNILYSLTLFHPFWTGREIAVFQPQPIPFYFWIIPLFAILGLFLNRKNKHVLFFGAIALLGIFLSKQIGMPFQHVYLWLYTHVPGFNAFREASKFYFLVTLGYSVLIAAFIDWLWKNWSKNKLLIYGRYLIVLIAIGLFLWNTKPLITGEYQTLFVTRKINSDYLMVKDFVAKQPEYFRTFWAPQGSHFSYVSYSHPLADWSIFPIISKREIGEQAIEEKLKPGEVQIRLLNKPYANPLLDITSVKYVFIPLKETVNDDNLFFFQLKDRGYYIKELNKLSYLSRINIGTKDIVAYQNNNYRPHIYITDNQESISKIQSFTKIDSKFINPTEYTFSIKGVSKLFYLNFSETYHPDWRIRIGSFNWWDALTKKNYFIDDKHLLRNDATLNSYFLNPIEVCKVNKVFKVYKVGGGGCVRNADGSYDISGTLYFKPQSYMYLGLIISGATLVAVLGYLIFAAFGEPRLRRVLGKNLYERKNK